MNTLVHLHLLHFTAQNQRAVIGVIGCRTERLEGSLSLGQQQLQLIKTRFDVPSHGDGTGRVANGGGDDHKHLINRLVTQRPHRAGVGRPAVPIAASSGLGTRRFGILAGMLQQLPRHRASGEGLSIAAFGGQRDEGRGRNLLLCRSWRGTQTRAARFSEEGGVVGGGCCH
jgi:hypothetical protein